MTAAASTQQPRGRHADDAKLLRLIARGDKLACSELYDRFSRPLYSLALRILNDRSAAEDIVHEVFRSLRENTETYTPRYGSALAWAIALTRRRAIDRLHERRRGTAADVPPLKEETENPAGTPPDFSALLPEELATLELAFFSDLTPPEIAAQLNELLSTIKARVLRGLLKLRNRGSQRS
jgi:RNA polymerase sigma-70 factor (ECF subfamily)